MKLKHHIREALINLSSLRLRSLLALLGILIGTASVVAMVSCGELATNEALSQFEHLGTDLLAISITDQRSQKKVTADTELSMSKAMKLITVSPHIMQVAPYTLIYDNIRYQAKPLNGQVMGVTESFAKVLQLKLHKGRFVSFLDKREFFCVLGNQLYHSIQAQTSFEPVGQQLQIGDHLFTIIGVLEAWPDNGFIYASIDNAVLVPLLASLSLSQYVHLDNLVLQLSPMANIVQVEQQLRHYINQAVADKQLYFRSAKQLITSMKKQSETLTVLLSLIGGISLLVGGIGVMNIMLISVIERKREIGIRLAVGAVAQDIRVLFLVEAVLLSICGGILGVLLGEIISYSVSWYWQWHFELFLLPLLIGFGVSFLAGVSFGYYPAYKASKLNPIEALRSD